MKTLNLLFVFIALFAFTFTTTAQTTKKAVAKHQIKQNARIHQGIHSGELTAVEAKKVKAQQRDINQTKRAAKADGKVTAKEKAIIKHKQKHANANIARKKNNERSR
jgi:hypothetical protein